MVMFKTHARLSQIAGGHKQVIRPVVPPVMAIYEWSWPHWLYDWSCNWSYNVTTGSATSCDRSWPVATGRMTSLPSYIKRCSIKHQDQYHFFQVPEHVPPLNPGTHPVMAPFPLFLFCGICIRGVQLLWQHPAVVVAVNAGGAAWVPVFKVAPMPWWCALFQNQPPFIIPVIGHATSHDNLWLVVQAVMAICDWLCNQSWQSAIGCTISCSDLQLVVWLPTTSLAINLCQLSWNHTTSGMTSRNVWPK